MKPYKLGKLLANITNNKLVSFGITNSKLYKLDIAITYRCNVKCMYCNIWKINDVEELKPDEYEKIFKKLDLSWLHLTGGEPFLREDFSSIVIKASKSMRNLLLIDTSTNGILTEKIMKDVGKILGDVNTNFEVGVSIDGTKEIHDRIRGVTGAWESATKTYFGLEEMAKQHDNFNVHINYVISPENLGKLHIFLDEIKKHDIKPKGISLEVARSSHFFRNEKSDVQMDKEAVIREIDYFLKLYKNRMNTFDRRYVMRLLYLDYMKDYLNTSKRIPCAAGRGSLFLDPYGLVYPCSAMEEPIGSARENFNIESLLKSEGIVKWRERYENCRQCWSGCEGVTSMIQNIPFTLFRLMKHLT